MPFSGRHCYHIPLLLSALMLFRRGNIEAGLQEDDIARAGILYRRPLSVYDATLTGLGGQIRDMSDTGNLQKEVDRLRLQSGFLIPWSVVDYYPGDRDEQNKCDRFCM